MVTDDAKQLFAGLIPANWKQENALCMANEDIRNRKDYNPRKLNQFQKEVTKLIRTKLEEVIDTTDYFAPHYYYLKEMLFLGNIHGYQNVYLHSIERHPDTRKVIIFHLKFEVENLLQDEVDRLKTIEQERFNGMNDEQFKAVKASWKNLNDEIRKKDVFIPDFDYCYIYELPTDSLNTILNAIIGLLDNDDYKTFAANYIAKKTVQRPMMSKAQRGEKFTYAELLAYWDLTDELDDIHYRRTPDEQTLAMRKARREKSEEQYNADNQRTKKMMDKLLKEIEAEEKEEENS